MLCCVVSGVGRGVCDDVGVGCLPCSASVCPVRTRIALFVQVALHLFSAPGKLRPLAARASAFYFY